MLHQGVPHHIACLEIGEADSIDSIEDIHDMREPGHIAAGQVDLRDVAGDDSGRGQRISMQRSLLLAEEWT